MPAPVIDVPVIEQVVRVDGVLDEAAWAQATVVTSFTRFQPTAGGPPEGRTEVRFLQSEDVLYVGVRVTQTPQPVRARVSPREKVDSDDQIGLYLDPFHDGRQGFIFYLNALGIQQDIRFDNGAWDLSWDTVLRSRGVVDPDGRGYTLEVAIPFRSLKYGRTGAEQDWGVILTRKIPGEGAKYGFPELVRSHPAWFTQAATLRVHPPQRASGVELIPGLTARAASARTGAGAPEAWTGPGQWGEVFRPQVDLRVGLSPSTGLVAAINPDFSQVESDVVPVTLNRRFAFRFPEQRPFFTEGANYLVDEVAGLYTRTIVEPLYGVKVAGREGAWSIGVLHALDRAPASSIHERGTPGFDDAAVADRWAADTVVRLRRDLPGAGQLGLTWTDKRLVEANFGVAAPGAPPRGAADTLGLDATVQLPRRWQVRGWHDQSFVAARGEVLAGAHTGLLLTRPSGAGVGSTTNVAFSSKDYRQELGFRAQSGLLDASSTLDWTIPGRGRLSTVTPGVTGQVFQEVNGDHLYAASGRLDLLVDGVHRLTLTSGWHHRREVALVDARLHGWSAGATYAGQIGAAVELTPAVSFGRELDFTDLTPARRAQVQLDTALRPIKPLRIDLLGRWLRYERETAGEGIPTVRDDLLVRGRVQWQLTQQWGLRIIAAYNRVDGALPGVAAQDTRRATLESSALLTWLLHPFTAVYVGYAQLDVLDAQAAWTSQRSVFLKAHVWWRP